MMFSLLAQTTDENVKKVFGEGIKDVPLSGGSVGETFSQVFGLGDLLFLVMICPLFSPVNFVFFYILSFFRFVLIS